MGEKNRAKDGDIILNRSKEYYINNKEQKVKEYQKEYRKNMSDEKNKRSKNIKKNIERI